MSGVVGGGLEYSALRRRSPSKKVRSTSDWRYSTGPSPKLYNKTLGFQAFQPHAQ
jgi:hypothetical protein